MSIRGRCEDTQNTRTPCGSDGVKVPNAPASELISVGRQFLANTRDNGNSTLKFVFNGTTFKFMFSGIMSLAE